MLLTFALQMVTVNMPFLNLTFTMTLTLDHLALCLLLSTVVIFAVELEKWVRRHGWLAQQPENLNLQFSNEVPA
ncbi:MAG: hypothetical protein KC587_11795 [Nitrospira sp.]|nr:hypothetical protein [Nitrospira sp.]MCA9457338.1 hypothetical protein [Nitrospira sp.]